VPIKIIPAISFFTAKSAVFASLTFSVIENNIRPVHFIIFPFEGEVPARVHFRNGVPAGAGF
jgi:hypothetical protein